MQEMAAWAPVFFFQNSEQRKWRVTRTRISPHLTVIHGLLPMWNRFERRGWLWAQKAATWHYLRSLRQRFSPLILWDAENCLRTYRYIPHDLAIYDCIDPCFSTQPDDIRSFEAREAEMCVAADLVFASAETLLQRCRCHSRRVHLLNNACDPAEYADDLLAAAPRPEWWPHTTAPIAAYLGTLDARFDFPTITHACRQHPQVHFILAGRVLPEYQTQIEALRQLGNVTIPGPVSLEQGRYLLSHAAIGLIPFTPGAMNDAINPVKMYAHALLGKPTVGTAIAELLARPDVAFTAASPEEFATCIPRALQAANDPATTARLRHFAQQNTWTHRASTAWHIIEEALSNHSGHPSQKLKQPCSLRREPA
jgi:hypothetical protein